MLDISLIRNKPDFVREQMRKLGDDAALARIDSVLELDEKRRALIQERDTLQSHRNRLNKTFGRLRGDKNLDKAVKIKRAYYGARELSNRQYAVAEAILAGEQDEELSAVADDLDNALNQLLDALRGISNHHGELDDSVKAVEEDLNGHMLWIPNLPHESVPVGEGDEDNVAHEPQGTFREFDFEPKAHWDLGPALGMIDFERGVKLSGSRFYILQGPGARLQRALASFFIDRARERGFIELYVPFMVREEMMFGSGQFPKFRDVVYEDTEADLFMLPTAEVAVTNMHRDEIFEATDLPLYYVAETPCFRREKASAGKDTRGIKRVHQFQKVEMYKFTTPETSYDELESLTEAAEAICRDLAIPYRRLEISTGDLGFTATKKYDVEMWAPGSEEWLEVSSCSNTEDFQARRAMIRYYPDGERKTHFVHTLNGSGLALPRVIIAIMENYQQADGSIVIPEVLRPYLNGMERIEPV